MPLKLTDAVIKAFPPPLRGNKIHYDSEVKGFGCRVTAAGAKAFVLNYRSRAGRERRFTIGSFPDWRTPAARTEAAELKRRIDCGDDPLASLQAERTAPTVADLCARYIEEHLPKKRPSSQGDDRSMIERDILPALKHRRVAEVSFSDVDALHRAISRRAKFRANRVVALLSKMSALAIRWQWRIDNPARGIERNPENKRERYVAGDELERLSAALAEHPDQQAANIFRLLLLTGARKSEVLSARWEQFDLTTGVWTKPGATTKQKTEHRVPLSAPARQLLSELYTEAGNDAEYVFPGRGAEAHRIELKRNWTAICAAAGLSRFRIHDLRHSYASILASAGLSLPVIGALLGHTQPQTTARYAHLLDDPLRAATDCDGATDRCGRAAERRCAMTYAPPGFIANPDALEPLGRAWFPELVKEIERAEGEYVQTVKTTGDILRLWGHGPTETEKELALRTFAKLRDLLCLGRIYAYYRDSWGRKKENPGFWETQAGELALLQGYLPATVLRPSVPFWFAVEEIEAITSTDPLGRPGAKPKADWQALEGAFVEEVRERGLPDKLNVKDWRCQADVERWLSGMVEREGDPVSETTIRERARAFLTRARQRGTEFKGG